MRRGSRGGRPPGPRAADPGAARSRGGGSTDLPEQGWRERRPARSGRPQFAAGVELRRRAASLRFCSKTSPGPAASSRRGWSSVRRRRSGGGARIRRAGEDVAVTSSPPLLLAGRAAGEHKEAHAVASASGRRQGRCRSSSQGRRSSGAEVRPGAVDPRRLREGVDGAARWLGEEAAGKKKRRERERNGESREAVDG
jgi:hypothetical protein